MEEVFSELSDLLNRLPVSDWGVADISEVHSLGKDYPRAISLILKYPPMGGCRGYDEESFHRGLEETVEKMNGIVRAVVKFLDDGHIKYLRIKGSMDPVELTGLFSHKLAATRAGLGWIGKSSLLISRRYGARVRLATILVDLPIPSGEPVTAGECGDCRQCADACPFGCIRGAEWSPGLDREELLDVHKCNTERAVLSRALGRRHECGLCLWACPKGQ